MTKLTIVGGREAKTKSRALTGKQLCFVDQIVSGQSQTEAYKHCYNTSRMSSPTIHSRDRGENRNRAGPIAGQEAPIA